MRELMRGLWEMMPRRSDMYVRRIEVNCIGTFFGRMGVVNRFSVLY